MRYLIYFVYNAAGRIDDYIPPLLAGLRARYDVIHVVFNGSPAEGEVEKLESVADKIQIRENVGFDVGAYTAALFSNPDDFYAGLSELTLANFTFFAPIGDLSDYFSWSDSRPMDFWGISAHKSMTPNPFTGSGELPYHIQSHWITVGPKILKSQDFLAYWRNLPKIDSYISSVLHHESQFTRHFARLGYSYGVYLDDSTYQSDYPAFNEVDRAIREGLPLLKRRLFYHVPTYLDRYEVNLRGAMEHIEKTAAYDASLIWRSVVGSVDPGVLYQNADLLYIVPDETALVDSPAQMPRVFLTASGEFSTDRIAAIVRRIGFDCKITLCAPTNGFADAFVEASGGNDHIAAVEPHVYNSLSECFELLARLLDAEDTEQALLFATVSDRTLEKFYYGLNHLARDSTVASAALARLQNTREFGLVLPPMRTFGKTPDTSVLTEDIRFELQNDLNALGLDQSLEGHVLYSSAGVVWIRAGLLAQTARHFEKFLVGHPIFEEFRTSDDTEARHQLLDGNEFDSFLAAGLPYFARDNGYGTFVLSNTTAMPQNFVKLEARYRRFAERLGMGDPFEIASHADYLMRFSSQEDRETIFSEVHQMAYETGWKNAIDTVWEQAADRGHELSVQMAGDRKAVERVLGEIGKNDWTKAAGTIRAQLVKDGFDKGFEDGWMQAADAIFDKAFNEGWSKAQESLNWRQLGARMLRRITGSWNSKK